MWPGSDRWAALTGDAGVVAGDDADGPWPTPPPPPVLLLLLLWWWCWWWWWWWLLLLLLLLLRNELIQYLSGGPSRYASLFSKRKKKTR